MRTILLVLTPLVLLASLTFLGSQVHAADDVPWHKTLAEAKTGAKPILVYVRDGT